MIVAEPEVHRVNWPKHCDAFIVLSKVIQSASIASKKNGASRELVYICPHCRKVGTFADFR